MTPQRIQRRRAKGWRKPEGAVWVGRGQGSKWGNDYQVIRLYPKKDVWYIFNDKTNYHCYVVGQKTAHEVAVFMYEKVQLPALMKTQDIHELTGKDLMCYCQLELACHCDVLLKGANEETK